MGWASDMFWRDLGVEPVTGCNPVTGITPQRYALYDTKIQKLVYFDSATDEWLLGVTRRIRDGEFSIPWEDRGQCMQEITAEIERRGLDKTPTEKGKIKMSIFDKYADKINPEDLKASQQEIQANADGGNREEVPVGKYEVKVDKLECKMSKKNNRMVSIWFKILRGKYANSLLFYNGVFHEDWMRHRVAGFLSDLLADGDRTAEINLILKSGNMQTINGFCMDVHEAIDGQKLEYLLDYGMSKGYTTCDIVEVYES